MKQKLFLNIGAMILAGVMSLAFTSCGSDDEPVFLQGVEASGSTFDLNEAGVVSVKFSVTPADAPVDFIALTKGAETFEVVNTTSTGNGNWSVGLKAKDLAALKANNAITLRVAQSSTASSEINVNIADPFSIAGKFEISNPREFDYYGVEPEHKFETCLPFVVTAKNASDIALLDATATKVTDGVTSQVVSASNFVFSQMNGDLFGYVLRVNPDKLADVQAAVPTYATINYRVFLISKNGRSDVLLLSAAACAPQGTPIVDNQLTATSAELVNPDFSKVVTLDVTNKLRHVGVASLKGQGDVTIEEIGMMNDKGEIVREESFTPVYKMTDDGKMLCDFSISGSAQSRIAAGNYTWVQRFHVTMTIGGVKYTTACADLRFTFTVK